MLNHLPPLSLPAYWVSQNKTEQYTAKINSWLYDNDSLTQKLETLSQKFEVHIRQQRTMNATDSALSGYFDQENSVLLREVFLHCDDLPVIFAQTEIPLSTLTQELADLGSDSLGNILFKDKTMRRGPIEVAQLTEKSQLNTLCESIKQNCSHPLWVRRSLFYLNNKPLLVSELFLPASDIYSL